MLRRFLVTLIRRSFVLLLLVCLGCVAQSAPPDLARKIEHQMRSYYNIPTEVKVIVGEIAPSTDWPGYDTVAVTIDGESKKQDYKFLLSKDRNTMMRITKFDLTKDPFAELMSKIDVNGRPSRGAKGAKVVVVNYDDFECPFCSRMHADAVSGNSQGIRRPRHVHLQGLSAGGDSSLGHSRRGRRQLPGRAERRCLLGFRRLHSRQQARSGQRKNAARRASTCLDKMAAAARPETQRGRGASCSPASRRRTKTAYERP